MGYDHVKLPGSRAVGPVISRVTCTPVVHDAITQPEAAEPTVPVKVTESGRCKKKTLELKDRDLCNRAAEKSKLFPFPPSYCNTTKTASPFSDSAKFVYEDVPMKPPSYLDAVRSGLDVSASVCSHNSAQQLCPFAAVGECHYGDSCLYLHGDVCEVCELQVLHPTDLEQRRAHEQMCLIAFEQDMEKAFAVQKSQDKVCNICMEIVYDKIPSERRFGILSDCIHPYCLSCIRQWRCAKQFENKIIKSCPECRVVSEFVIPSAYWVEEKEEKDQLIEAFKQGMSKKACKYFDKGKGSCPFGGKCLYLHAYPDGTMAEPEQPRKQLSSEGNVRFLHSVRLWDFIEEREHRDVPQHTTEDEVAELGDLFMHLSGTEERNASSESQADQPVSVVL
ncbi:probable E3 ubiquitin-protein ligase makorin-2 isoform X3 [Scyliorhinus canicula]|uniref:probable E3 ubiquitin-protein ligase makorin-2 isoform X3 n=1 Tax=Scyliorhinus canicula TaxID=7830 RepID=UPI0018F291F0|nr:probable E3 ubiquitin-protein ligase makorin-2 isoform X3 [Scyliorhinus canicula]XP_038668608.1 probable E3 ubiquitin-protein ligase makorin-2 isoform X3 [Scyliorhinus canicula]